MRVAVAPIIVATFIISLVYCCMCGAYCADSSKMASQAETASSCCSSCDTSELPETKPCCSDEPGESCCETELTEHLVNFSAPEIHADIPVIVLFVADLVELRPAGSFSHADETGYREHRPPSYLQFQSFLI